MMTPQRCRGAFAAALLMLSGAAAGAQERLGLTLQDAIARAQTQG